MPALFFEVEWLKIILLMGGTLLVTAVVVGVGGYFALRIFASVVNSRRDTWELTASEVGLKLDRTSMQIVKPLEGISRSHKVKVISFGVPRGKSSYDNHVSCEAFLQTPISFPFAIKSRAGFIQQLASVFVGYDMEIGVPSFDDAYHVESAAPDVLRKILLFEPENGLRPSVLTDIFLIQKRSISIEVSDISVKVTIEANVEESGRIKTALNDAITLTERFQAAYDATLNVASTTGESGVNDPATRC